MSKKRKASYSSISSTEKLGLYNIASNIISEYILNDDELSFISTKVDPIIADAAANERANNNALKTATERSFKCAVAIMLEKGVKPKSNASMLNICRNGNLELLKLFTRHGADLEKKLNPLQERPIDIACDLGHIHILKYLLKQGVCPYSDSAAGSPLPLVVLKGDKEMTKMLLNYTNNLIVNDFGRIFLKKDNTARVSASEDNIVASDEGKKGQSDTPLIAAILANNEEMVHLLVERGADVNLLGSFQNTPLTCAARHGSPELVQFLFESGAQMLPDSFCSVINHIYITDEFKMRCVDFIIKYQADTFREKYKFIFQADLIVNNNPIFKYLCSQIKNDKYFEGVRNYIPFCVLGFGRSKALKILKELIEEGWSYNAIEEDGNSLLHQACLRGNVELIEYLVGLGLDINLRNKYGYTPLHKALRTMCESQGIEYKKEAYEQAKYLLQIGANPFIKNYEGESSFNMYYHRSSKSQLLAKADAALSKGRGESLFLTMLKKACDINLPLDLHELAVVPAQINCVDSMKILIDRGVNIFDSWKGPLFHKFKLDDHGSLVQMIDTFPVSLIHIAATSNSLSVLKLLISHDLDPNFTPENSYSPLYGASTQNSSVKVLDYLVACGARMRDAEKIGYISIHGSSANFYNKEIPSLASKDLYIKELIFFSSKQPLLNTILKQVLASNYTDIPGSESAILMKRIGCLLTLHSLFSAGAFLNKSERVSQNDSQFEYPPSEAWEQIFLPLRKLDNLRAVINKLSFLSKITNEEFRKIYATTKHIYFFKSDFVSNIKNTLNPLDKFTTLSADLFDRATPDRLTKFFAFCRRHPEKIGYQVNKIISKKFITNNTLFNSEDFEKLCSKFAGGLLPKYLQDIHKKKFFNVGKILYDNASLILDRINQMPDGSKLKSVLYEAIDEKVEIFYDVISNIQYRVFQEEGMTPPLNVAIKEYIECLTAGEEDPSPIINLNHLDEICPEISQTLKQAIDANTTDVEYWKDILIYLRNSVFTGYKINKALVNRYIKIMQEEHNLLGSALPPIIKLQFDELNSLQSDMIEYDTNPEAMDLEVSAFEPDTTGTINPESFDYYITSLTGHLISSSDSEN
ncbi:MAG: ankyrin repeat domain-containing protein [Rickettsiaceae bacterium]|nr:ankyrin repeat domain-containing protein [Rickettsiaceae bacterium]